MTGQATSAQSRLRINVLSNLTANVWLAALTFLAIPFIYRGVGAAQYAVVGMYLLAIQWSAFLDLGLSPALGRFAARHSDRAEGVPRVRYLLARFEPFNWGLGLLLVVVGLLLFGLRESILDEWRSNTEAPLAIAAMLLLTLALRIAANLYRSGLTGLELQVQVSAINSVVVGLRMGLPIALVLMDRLDLPGFFTVQCVVGALEAFWFRRKLLDHLGERQMAISSEQLRKNLLLGLSIAGLGVLWVLSLQVDKLILSANLSLEDFGSYILAVQLAAAVSLITAPLQTAVLPRMTAQLAVAETEALTGLYTSSTMLCTALGASAAFAVLVGGESLMQLIVENTAQPFDLHLIVAAYAFTNGLVAVMAMSYALQNAVGVLRWHWMGAVGLGAVQIPVMYLLALRGDVLLLALAYMGSMLVYIVLWLPQAHSRFLPGGHLPWLGRGLLAPLLPAIPVGLACVMLLASDAGWPTKLLQSGLTFCLVLSSAVLASKDARLFLWGLLKRDV